MKRILSGMQPTGNLHLGNYLGALKNWVALQDKAECYYCVVDLHAITIPQPPEKLRAAIRETAAAYIACGIDAKKSKLFAQSAVSAHTQLMWILATLTPLGWLNRMTQYKDKSAKSRDLELLGLYSYPVLMAADVLAYKATLVPVGEDQKQHVELMRDLAGAFNRQYNVDYFTLPEPHILGEATRVMSLRDGTKKMSKSEESDYSRINLTDDADEIAAKIKKAKTDSDPLPDNLKALETRPEADNLVTIYAALTDRTRLDVLEEFAGAQFSKFKPALIAVATDKLAPITDKMRRLINAPDELDRILEAGGGDAHTLTQGHFNEIKDIIGMPSTFYAKPT